MTKLEILDELKKIFTLVVNRNMDVSTIKMESKIVNDLGISSVGLIYLMVAIEETFDIDMSDASFDSFETVQDVVNYIYDKE
ncbi:MAG: acyl carrier protein [Bacilli bacterium]|jgi:acyl carrier protein|nr:acyl carrier protein [Bacilli bacterium]